MSVTAERPRFTREAIKVSPGVAFSIDPDLDHPASVHWMDQDYREYDKVLLDLSEFFPGRQVIGDIKISEFPTHKPSRYINTPRGRVKGGLPITVEVSASPLNKEEAAAIRVSLVYRGRSFEMPLYGDITLIQRGERHHHTNYGFLSDGSDQTMWSEFERDPNLFKQSIRFQVDRVQAATSPASS